MVTHRRIPILVEQIDLLRKSFALSKQRYDYTIDAIVVLPDHLHMIITPKHAEEYPKIISHIKRAFVYGLNTEIKIQAKYTLTALSYKRQRSGIWQKCFYEHTIRDEKDLHEKMDYIRYNAVKHGLADDWQSWKYSSFV